MTVALVRDLRTLPRTPLAAVVASWASVVLVVVATALPPVLHWNVHANGLAPLSATWRPRVGIGTVPAVLLAFVAWRRGEAFARGLAWPRLLLLSFVAAFAWAVSLALVDGRAGLADQLDTGGYSDYLSAARGVHDISATLHGFLARIPAGSVDEWPTHVAGHPPGALLFFVLLVRLGLGGGLAAGLVVTVFAASVPVAVLATLRALGAESVARRVALVVTLGPSAIWSAVSGDAVFAVTLAWGLCALALAARARGPAVVGWGLPAGLLLGVALLMSYGLAVAGLLAVGVLLAARSVRAVVPAAVGVVAVVGVFAAAGFRWWQALPVLHDRYYAGLAHLRPASYWVWGDLAALVLAAGPALAASVSLAVSRARRWRRAPQPTRVVVTVTVAAALCIVLADATLLSKAEVERIWLPFVPWLLLGVALLTPRWRRLAVGAGLLSAVLLQSLLFTHW